MDSKLLAFGFLEYVVFLFSTTCHEASHALAAKWGGDQTAFESGQVSLNPLPHIRREFFGMVLLPMIGILTGTGLIGYASAPYDPAWAIRNPKRSGLMSLAGPGSNFALAILAAIIMRIGLEAGFFLPGAISTDAIVATQSDGLAAGIATVLSVLFSLNILLGCFNLLPIPPLDGFGALTVFTGSEGALTLMKLRVSLRGFGMLAGILIASTLLGYVYDPLLEHGVRLIYAFYHFPHVQP
ncbi:MAG TPA: site-2 protease family protein [Bryobacteraceae bacterium]|nr:site-2 protease family protein [Bryobacteraceae bacterium]